MCVYACTHVRMYAFVHVHNYVHVCGRMCVCVYVVARYCASAVCVCISRSVLLQNLETRDVSDARRNSFLREKGRIKKTCVLTNIKVGPDTQVATQPKACLLYDSQCTSSNPVLAL